MSGYYIHIPFCAQACSYCDFHFSTSRKLQSDMVSALVKEIGQRPSFEQTETLYFGGGTPSLLTDAELRSLISAVNSVAPIRGDAEITLEVNPEDVSAERLEHWYEMGINRVSMGVQSFVERDLRLMNRNHSEKKARLALDHLAKSRIESINADLIFAIPGQSVADTVRNIEIMTSYPIEHISAYALTVEPKTALSHQIAKGVLQPQSDEQYCEHFNATQFELESRGYEQYEISNYSKPGKKSRHNTSYWSGKSYVGIGPGAHSYDGDTRRWNVSNNPVYIRNVRDGKRYFEEEKLTDCDRLNEYLMTALRRMEGVSLMRLEALASEDQMKEILQTMKRLTFKGLLTMGEDRAVLTNRGKLVSNSVASDLFQLD